MNLRTIALGAAAAALIAIPAVAEAAWGQATGNVNMRTCASTSCAKIITVPAGARVWVGGSMNGWYQVSFGGFNGFVSGSRIAVGFANLGPRPDFRRFPPPQFGYVRQPWWDNRHQAWYDGRRWYRNGAWYNNPNGFSFGFSFGG